MRTRREQRPSRPTPIRYRVTVRHWNGERFDYHSEVIRATSEASARIQALAKIGERIGTTLGFSSITEVEVIG